MSYEKVFVFSAAVRGYHFDRDTWDTEENQQLICSHETKNAFDIFAIKNCQTNENKIVGYLPREISRA